MKNRRPRLQESSSIRTIRVAVTGGAGSGKTTVCRRLKQLGATVISADELAREAVIPGTVAYTHILKYFGREVLADDGALDRRKLRRIILNDPGARKIIEEFIHPEVIRLMLRRVDSADQAGDPVVVVEVPLLYEAGLQGYFDLVLMVGADHGTKLQRLMQRDAVSRDEAESLLKAQMPDDRKIEQSEIVLNNSSSLEDLTKAVDRTYTALLQKYSKSIETA